jgi:hypothetical protein
LNRTVLATAISLAAVSAAFATSARVESMGKHATYFQDDANIWLNPANANLYPNYLLGELGVMHGGKDTSKNNNPWGAMQRYNSDPTGTWFGAIFAKSLGKDETQTGRYPQVLIGGAFNRDDEWLSYMPSAVQVKVRNIIVPTSTDTKVYDVSDYTVKWDGILGFASDSGNLFGLKTYFAFQDTTNGKLSVQSVVNTYTLGANIPFGSSLSLEANGTIGFLSTTIDDGLGDTTRLPMKYKTDLSPSFGADVRMFIDASPWPLVVVPAASFRLVNAPSRTLSKFRAGSGANVSLDRGFFWMGVDYFNSSDERFQSGVDTATDSAKAITIAENGLRVGFGIERNIWTDWFVIRIGGQKVIKQKDVSGSKGAYSVLTTNPENNDYEEDLVSFGFGVNIEDKFKVDAVMEKDILFTGGSLFGREPDHVLSRISASYSF